MGTEPFAASVTRLRDALATIRLPLDTAESRAVQAMIDLDLGRIDDQLLPRLHYPDAPVVVVLGGSVGAGKATLLNSLLGRKVVEAATVRARQADAVIVHSPEDADWLASAKLLPNLTGLRSAADQEGRRPTVVADQEWPRGVVLVAAPGLESVAADDRELAERLLAIADHWLFVTSAARYADAVPWQALRSAAARRLPMAVVLDRTPADVRDEVAEHLEQMLSQRGLGAAPLFVIEDTDLDDDGLLPAAASDPVRQWLADLVAEPERRTAQLVQGLDGSVAALVQRAGQIVDLLGDQAAAVAGARQAAVARFDVAAEFVHARSGDGSLLGGPVAAGWHEFAGSGEIVRNVERRIGWIRGRGNPASGGRPEQAKAVVDAIVAGLATTVDLAAETAGRDVAVAWSDAAVPVGQVASEPAGGTGATAATAAERSLTEWRSGLEGQVRSVASTPDASSKLRLVGTDGMVAALAIAACSPPDGEDSARGLLAAVWGPQAAASAIEAAGGDLRTRLSALVAAKAAVWIGAVDALAVNPADTDELRGAAEAVAAAGPDWGADLFDERHESSDASVSPEDTDTDTGDGAASVDDAEPTPAQDSAPPGSTPVLDADPDSDLPPLPALPIPPELDDLVAEAVRRPHDSEDVATPDLSTPDLAGPAAASDAPATPAPTETAPASEDASSDLPVLPPPPTAPVLSGPAPAAVLPAPPAVRALAAQPSAPVLPAAPIAPVLTAQPPAPILPAAPSVGASLPAAPDRSALASGPVPPVVDQLVPPEEVPPPPAVPTWPQADHAGSSTVQEQQW